MPLQLPLNSAGAACGNRGDSPGCLEPVGGEWERLHPWDGGCFWDLVPPGFLLNLRWLPHGRIDGLPLAAGWEGGERLGLGCFLPLVGQELLDLGSLILQGWGGGRLQAAVFFLNPRPSARLPFFSYQRSIICLLYYFPVFKVIFSWRSRKRWVYIIYSLVLFLIF